MSNQSKNKANDEMVSLQHFMEGRKMVYGHCIEMHKVFLSWRERLLAGYATLIAALAFAYSWAYNSENPVYFSRTIGISGIVLTLVFLLLDRRTRVHYRTCIEVGSNIERQLGIADREKEYVGFYSSFQVSYAELNAVRRLRLRASSHSGAIDLLAFAAIIGMLILLIFPPIRTSRVEAASNSADTAAQKAPAVSSPSQTQ